MDKKILIVENDAELAPLLKDAFSIWGFRVFFAKDGKEGLKVIKKNQDIKVIIADYKMPDMEGIYFLELASSIAKDTSKIIISACDYLESILKTFDREKELFKLPKTFDLQGLFSLLVKVQFKKALPF